MKRIVGMLVAVLLSVGLMYSQEKLTEMTGKICYSKCISQSVESGKPLCDPDCKDRDRNGEAVFVDDLGVVTKIANQDMVMPYVGKKVKMHCKMTKEKHMLKVIDITAY
jgi:hypothetical protein